MTGVSTRNRWVKRTIAVAVGALALLALAGAGSAARGPRLALAWQAPTPRDGAAFTVNAGSSLTITFPRPAHGGAEPRASARVVGRLPAITPERVQNVTLRAERKDRRSKGRYWVRVRLPMLPNGSTGWVPREHSRSAFRNRSGRVSWSTAGS